MTSPVWDEKGRTHNTGGSIRSGWSNPRIRAASPYPTHVVCRHVQTWRSAPRPVREPGPTTPRHPKPHGKTAEDAVLQEANGSASAGWWPPHQCAAPSSPPARGGSGGGGERLWTPPHKPSNTKPSLATPHLRPSPPRPAHPPTSTRRVDRLSTPAPPPKELSTRRIPKKRQPRSPLLARSVRITRHGDAQSAARRPQFLLATPS